MSHLSAEIVNKFAEMQEQVWENVTSAVAHSADPPMAFTFATPEATSSESIRSRAGETLLAIQFAFASSPEHNQLILLDQESFSQLIGIVKGEDIAEPDESHIPELREVLEAIVQGICLACGIAKNEPMVASGLSLRYQALVLPDNFTRPESYVKVQAGFSANSIEGSLTWFLDNPTVAYVTGFEVSDLTDEPDNARQLFGSAGPAPHLHQTRNGGEEVGGLDLLMDIPLEISVELGRMKMLVKDVVELGTGSIVEINKAAGEPVDVMVNGRLVARGEVVVIEDNFGVRITEILTAQERINRIGEAA
jgi:flagellar motor switch protein FliN/FliY